MSTTIDASKDVLSGVHRDWLRKMGAALEIPISGTIDTPAAASPDQDVLPPENQNPSDAPAAAKTPAAPGNAAQPDKQTAPKDSAATISVAGKPIIKTGSKGQDVKDAQTLLNKHGAKLNADGDFGKLTDTAVKEFQKANPPLKSDGVIGPKTWEALAASPPEPPKPEPDTKPRVAVFIVTDGANNAVKNAICKLGDLSEKTGDTGQATISIAPGSHPFGVTADGFEQAIGTFEVTADAESQQRVELKAVDPATKVVLSVRPTKKSKKDDKIELKATVTLAGGRTPPPGTIQFIAKVNGSSRQPLTQPLPLTGTETTHIEKLLPKGQHLLFAVYNPTPPAQGVVETKSEEIAHEVEQDAKGEDKDVAKRIIAKMEETDRSEFEEEVDKLRSRLMGRLLNILAQIQKAGRLDDFVGNFRSDKPGRERIGIAILTIQREFSREWFKQYTNLDQKDRKAVLARTPEKVVQAFELENDPADPPDPDAEPDDPKQKVFIEPALTTKASLEYESKTFGKFGSVGFDVTIGPNGRMKSADVGIVIVKKKLEKVSALGPILDLEGKLSIGGGLEFEEHQRVIVKEVQGAVKAEVEVEFREIKPLEHVKFVLGVKFANDGKFHFEGSIVIPIPGS